MEKWFEKLERDLKEMMYKSSGKVIRDVAKRKITTFKLL